MLKIALTGEESLKTIEQAAIQTKRRKMYHKCGRWRRLLDGLISASKSSIAIEASVMTVKCRGIPNAVIKPPKRERNNII
ncbi:MAG: hypothetical protein ACFFCW_14005 [Candidatus Hodarchaeota archaeon]